MKTCQIKIFNALNDSNIIGFSSNRFNNNDFNSVFPFLVTCLNLQDPFKFLSYSEINAFDWSFIIHLNLF